MVKKIKNYFSIVALTSLALIGGQVFAAKSSDVVIPGDTIKPASIIGPIMGYHKIVPNIIYNLTCTLVNPNQNGIVFAANADTGLSPKYGQLDGVMLDHQVTLAPGKHVLTFDSVSNAVRIFLINADQSDSIYTESCIATAVS